MYLRAMLMMPAAYLVFYRCLIAATLARAAWLRSGRMSDGAKRPLRRWGASFSLRWKRIVELVARLGRLTRVKTRSLVAARGGCVRVVPCIAAVKQDPTGCPYPLAWVLFFSFFFVTCGHVSTVYDSLRSLLRGTLKTFCARVRYRLLCVVPRQFLSRVFFSCYYGRVEQAAHTVSRTYKNQCSSDAFSRFRFDVQFRSIGDHDTKHTQHVLLRRIQGRCGPSFPCFPALSTLQCSAPGTPDKHTTHPIPTIETALHTPFARRQSHTQHKRTVHIP